MDENQRGKKIMTPTWTANKQNIKFETNVMSIIAWST